MTYDMAWIYFIFCLFFKALKVRVDLLHLHAQITCVQFISQNHLWLRYLITWWSVKQSDFFQLNFYFFFTSVDKIAWNFCDENCYIEFEILS